MAVSLRSKKKKTKLSFKQIAILTVLGIAVILLAVTSYLANQPKKITQSKADETRYCWNGGQPIKSGFAKGSCEYGDTVNKDNYVSDKGNSDDCRKCVFALYTGGFPYGQCNFANPNVCRSGNVAAGCSGICNWNCCHINWKTADGKWKSTVDGDAYDRAHPPGGEKTPIGGGGGNNNGGNNNGGNNNGGNNANAICKAMAAKKTGNSPVGVVKGTDKADTGGKSCNVSCCEFDGQCDDGHKCDTGNGACKSGFSCNPKKTGTGGGPIGGGNIGIDPPIFSPVDILGIIGTNIDLDESTYCISVYASTTDTPSIPTQITDHKDDLTATSCGNNPQIMFGGIVQFNPGKPNNWNWKWKTDSKYKSYYGVILKRSNKTVSWSSQIVLATNTELVKEAVLDLGIVSIGTPVNPNVPPIQSPSAKCIDPNTAIQQDCPAQYFEPNKTTGAQQWVNRQCANTDQNNICQYICFDDKKTTKIDCWTGQSTGPIFGDTLILTILNKKLTPINIHTIQATRDYSIGYQSYPPDVYDITKLASSILYKDQAIKIELPGECRGDVAWRSSRKILVAYDDGIQVTQSPLLEITCNTYNINAPAIIIQ